MLYSYHGGAAMANTTRTTITLGVEHLRELREIAKRLGYVNAAGVLVGAGNISAMLTAIAEGEEVQVLRGRPERVAERIRRDIERSLGMPLDELLARVGQLTPSGGEPRHGLRIRIAKLTDIGDKMAEFLEQLPGSSIREAWCERTVDAWREAKGEGG